MPRSTKTPLTKFGKELAKLRIDEDESRADMAKRLGLSEPTLKSIEIGRRAPWAKEVSKIAEVYGLDADATTELRNLGAISRSSFVLKPEGAAADAAREVLALLEDRMEDISESEWYEIRSIAGGGGE